jgi:TPR repeat protein
LTARKRTKRERELTRRAEAGDLEACVTLADSLSRSGDEALKAEALGWYERAADLGDVLSMETLGRSLQQGWGAPANPELARSWFARAAAGFEEASRADDAFTATAMAGLAALLLAGDGVPRDVARAVSLFEESAARGNHWASISLGEAYERGTGVARDPERARRTFERAIAAGADDYARHCLERVNEALHEAATTQAIGAARVDAMLLAAAESGDAAKMWALAGVLDRESEFAEARRWKTRAADAGHAVAAFALSLDSEAADERARWRRGAAGLGHVTALQMLGDFWLESDAGASDPAYGYAWIELATRDRHAEPASTAVALKAQAKQRASEVWDALTEEQRERARQILARCDAGPPYGLPDEV